MAHPTMTRPVLPAGTEGQARTIVRLVQECITRVDDEASRFDATMNDPAAGGDRRDAVTRFRIVIRNAERFLAYATRLRDLLGTDQHEVDRETWRLRRRVSDGAEVIRAWRRHVADAEIASRRGRAASP